jgi:pyruvate carboxylase
MKNALQEFSIEGVETTAPFLRRILMDEDYLQGRLHTCFVDERMSSFGFRSRDDLEDIAVLSAAFASYLNRDKTTAVIPSRSKKQVSLWKASARINQFSNGDFRWIH